MMIPLVDDGDVDSGASQFLSRSQTAESRPDNDNAMYRALRTA
jgi:hypothetical protein